MSSAIYRSSQSTHMKSLEDVLQKTLTEINLRTKEMRRSIESVKRFSISLSMFSFLCFGLVLTVSAQGQLTMDATKQPSPPARGRGSFFGSEVPGHSPGLAVRLTFSVPTGELLTDGKMHAGNTLVDFVVTNIGAEPLTLPISLHGDASRSRILRLWFTSDAIEPMYVKDQSGRLVKSGIVPTSAELYGNSDEPSSLYVLEPTKSILIHASSRAMLVPGKHSFTAHAELVRVSQTSDVVGTADAEPVTATLRRAAFHTNVP